MALAPMFASGFGTPQGNVARGAYYSEDVDLFNLGANERREARAQQERIAGMNDPLRLWNARWGAISPLLQGFGGFGGQGGGQMLKPPTLREGGAAPQMQGGAAAPALPKKEIWTPGMIDKDVAKAQAMSSRSYGGMADRMREANAAKGLGTKGGALSEMLAMGDMGRMGQYADADREIRRNAALANAEREMAVGGLATQQYGIGQDFTAKLNNALNQQFGITQDAQSKYNDTLAKIFGIQQGGQNARLQLQNNTLSALLGAL